MSFCCRRQACEYRSHFEFYTERVFYTGPGRAALGVSQSPLWPRGTWHTGSPGPFRAFKAWLNDVEHVRSVALVVCGRQIVCDCGLDDCPSRAVEHACCSHFHSVSHSDKGVPLLSQSEWRQWLRRELVGTFDCVRLGSVLSSAILRKGGGISEFWRLHLMIDPNSEFESRADVMPVPLQAEYVVSAKPGDRRWRRAHHRQFQRQQEAPGVCIWRNLLALGCNYMFASCSRLLPSAIFTHAACGAAHRVMLERCTQAARLFAADAGSVRESQITEKLEGMRAGYHGEAISVPEPLSVAQIVQGLPPVGAGGRVDALTVASGSVRNWLEDPSLAIKPESDWPEETPRAKVHIKPGEEAQVFHLLWKCGIVKAIDERDVFHAHGKPVLQGMFGVVRPKDKPTPQGPGLRVIMNLIPSNAYLRELAGDVASLPMGGQWSQLVLLEDEVVWTYSEDQKASFYLFALPRAWWGFFTFNIWVPGWSVGAPELTRTRACACVIPMGWMLAVGAMQNIGRNLASQASALHRSRLAGAVSTPTKSMGGPSASVSSESVASPLKHDEVHELAGDRVFPLSGPFGSRSFHQVYLDNWDQFMIGTSDAFENMKGRPSPLQTAVRDVWHGHNVLRSEGKSIEGQLRAPCLGTLWRGDQGVIGPDPQRLALLLLMILSALSLEHVKLVVVQHLVGVACFCLQHQRPLFSILQATFHWMRTPKRGPLPPEVADELLTLACCLCSCFTTLRSPVDGVPVCTDACESGGGACEGVELNTVWHEFWQQELRAAKDGAQVLNSGITQSRHVAACGPLLVVSLFDGVGGLMQSLRLLGAPVIVFISIECKLECRRVVRKNFDVTLEYSYVEAVSDMVVASWFDKFGDLPVLWAAGSPCQNLSSLRGSDRLGLDGNKSVLFWEVPRVLRLLKTTFAKVFGFLENVSSMSDYDFHVMSAAMGPCIPFECDAACASWCRRKRVYWLDNCAIDSHADVVVERNSRCAVVSFLCTLPPLSTFIDVGCHALLPSGERYPTFTRPVPKKSKPRYVPGWERTSQAARARYAQNSFRYQGYQYEETYMVQCPSGLRLLNACERERIMGFASNHSVNMAKGGGSHFAQQLEDLRCDGIGNSFHCIVVARLLAQSVHGAGHHITCDSLWARWREQEDSRAARVALPRKEACDVPSCVSNAAGVADELGLHHTPGEAKQGACVQSRPGMAEQGLRPATSSTHVSSGVLERGGSSGSSSVSVGSGLQPCASTFGSLLTPQPVKQIAMPSDPSASAKLGVADTLGLHRTSDVAEQGACVQSLSGMAEQGLRPSAASSSHLAEEPVRAVAAGRSSSCVAASSCDSQSSCRRLLAEWSVAQHAVFSHLRCCDTRGTDVRLNPLQFFRPRVWPRQSIDTSQWDWQVVQSYRFSKGSHINALELRAILNYFRFRCRKPERLMQRVLLIVDSQVCASIVAKGRSSSLQLNTILRRLGGLCVLGNVRVSVGWCHSEWNPADAPSRAHVPESH